MSNPVNNAIGNEATAGGESRYVEGRLRRAVNENNLTLNFPVGLANGAEPFEIQFSSSMMDNTILAVHQENTTTAEGSRQPCDVGSPTEPFTPDGVVDSILIDCVTGQWFVEAENDITSAFDVNFFPSGELLSNCQDGIYFFIGENGVLEDCPDVDATDGITRSGLTNLGSFDIATGSQLNTIFSSTEVIPSNDSRISIFPNPISDNVVNLEIKGAVLERGVGTISIHDVLGRVVYKSQIEISGNQQTFIVQLPTNVSGIHQLIMRNKNQLVSKAFVVVK